MKPVYILNKIMFKPTDKIHRACDRHTHLQRSYSRFHHSNLEAAVTKSECKMYYNNTAVLEYILYYNTSVIEYILYYNTAVIEY